MPQSGSAFSRDSRGYYSSYSSEGSSPRYSTGAGSPHTSEGYRSDVSGSARHAAHRRPDTEPRQAANPYGADVSRGGSHSNVNPYLAIDPSNPRGSSRGGGSRKHNKNKLGIIITLVLVAVVGGVLYLFVNPPIFDVTINGESHRVNNGTTISEAITAGYASPTAGNLMAIDGTVATQGGGTAFTATFSDGSTTSDGDTKLSKDMVLTIGDGTDATESSTTTTEEIPFETVGTDITATDYYKGALHVYSKGVNGEQTTTTGDVSGVTITEVTKEAQNAGFIIGDAKVDGQKILALTFDDGPSVYTDQVLDVLEANDVKATFFTIGNQISSYPDAVKRASSMGCQICSHTWDHASGSGQGVNITYMTADEQTSEVTQGFDAIDSLLGTQVSRVFRAPGGNFYGSAVTNLEPLLTAEIGWDVDTEDWQKPGAESIENSLLSASAGCVVLMHDGGGDRSQTVEALSVALPQLKAEGYTFVTIDELLAYGLDV